MVEALLLLVVVLVDALSGATRPWQYFALIGALAAFIVGEHARHPRPTLFLAQQLVVALVFRASFFDGVTYYEDDPAFHLVFGRGLAEAGHVPTWDIPQVRYYSLTPALHLLIAEIASVVGSASLVIDEQVLNLSFTIVGAFLLYAVARGLNAPPMPAAFTLGTFLWVPTAIKYAYVVTTQFLSLLLLLVILAIVLHGRTRRHVSLVLFPLVLLVATHPFYSLFAIGVVLFLGALGFLRRDRDLALMAGLVGVIVWLSYRITEAYTEAGGGVANYALLGRAFGKILAGWWTTDAVRIQAATPTLSVIIDALPLIAFLGVGALGFWLGPRRSLLRYALVCGFLSVLPILLLGARLTFLRPTYFYFLVTPMVIALVWPLWKQVRLRPVVAALAAFLLVSFSIAGTIANERDPAWHAGPAAIWAHRDREMNVFGALNQTLPEGEELVTDVKTGGRLIVYSSQVYEIDFLATTNVEEVAEHDVLVVNRALAGYQAWLVDEPNDALLRAPPGWVPAAPADWVVVFDEGDYAAYQRPR